MKDIYKDIFRYIYRSMSSLNRWKYAINGLHNVYHIDEWPLYQDWLKVCSSGDVLDMSKFHNTWIINLNTKLLEENKDLTFYDSGWRYNLKLKYDPYKKLMIQSARDIVSNGGPIEAIFWFSKQKDIDPVQICYGINTLITIRKLKEAKQVLSLFPKLPFDECAKDVGSDIFREALMTNDIPLIHEMWLLGALESQRAKELCDDALNKKGWVLDEAREWYINHRNMVPCQIISGRYDYLR